MDVKTAADVTSNIITSAAVLVGGIWAYFKFIKGRTFAHRAELDVSPTLEASADSLYLAKLSMATRRSGRFARN